jgi:hypothetical protein
MVDRPFLGHEKLGSKFFLFIIILDFNEPLKFLSNLHKTITCSLFVRKEASFDPSQLDKFPRVAFQNPLANQNMLPTIAVGIICLLLVS